MQQAQYSLLSYELSNSLSLYDPLNGSTMGLPSIPGYSDGILLQGAVFAGNNNYIQYSVGSQIPYSGTVQFYINTAGFQPAYQCNYFFTQAGFGGATGGDIMLRVIAGNYLGFHQWSGYDWNSVIAQLPVNQWVKITATYGSLGMRLYVNDQLAASDLNRKISISSRPFYFGTRAFWGPERSFTGQLDEIVAFAGTPEVKIVSPASGTEFNPDEEITFFGFGLNLNWSRQGVSMGAGNIVKAVLPLGEHLITVSGQNAIGLPSTNNVRVVVKDDVAKIKIKNLDALDGVDPFAVNVPVSYKSGKTRFQAIGYRADETEIGPISVDWSLQGGVVSSLQPIRLGILHILGVSIPRIGNVGGSESVSNSSLVTFNSYLSGVITLQAQKGAKLATIEVKIKQPVVKVAFKAVRGVGFDLQVAEFLANKANEIWSAGGENLLNVKVHDFSWLENQPFESLPPDESSEYLLAPNVPSFLNPLAVDVITDAHFGLSYNSLDPRHVVPRQPEELLKFRTLFQKINVYLPKWVYCRDSLVEEVKAKAGVTISSRRYYEKTNISQPINDWDKGGIFLTYADEYLQDGGQADINQLLAHEIGHVLGLDHVNNMSYLMHYYALSTKISPEEYVWALNYLGNRPSNAAFVMEE